jgi:large subunit ribosomal protein L29
MKALKAKDLRDKSVEDLEAMILAERHELFNTRRDLVFRKVTDTAGLKGRRHNIARLLTVLGEKQRGAK